MAGATAIDFGILDYNACWELQRLLHQARSENRIADCLLLGEHPHVFTLGKKANRDNILVPEITLKERRIPCVEIERGGDVTYHGPGQLIAYPIFRLDQGASGTLPFLSLLEEVMIRILNDYGIKGTRNQRNRGVWVDDNKIGFVGIAVQRGVTLHGLALNLDPDLSFFRMIHPCGLKGVKVTSMRNLLGRTLTAEAVRAAAVMHFMDLFSLHFERIDVKGISPESILKALLKSKAAP